MSQRIKKEIAELVAIPPTTWYTRQVKWLINQETFKENMHSIPVNPALKESLERDGMLNPILVMPNWWPIAGSQRLRVLVDIPELHSAEVRVCKFDKEWWLLYYLWGDEDFRNKAIAIWFQMAELVWKSMYYEDDPSFLEHEALGDELPWKHKSKLMDK